MAQHYNFSTTGSSSPPDSSTNHNVPEDFDLTNFLLRSRPPDGMMSDEEIAADTSWPQRVQDMKNPPGNTYGLPENYASTGWSADLRRDDASAASSMYNSSCWAPSSGATVGSSVYPGVNSSYNPAANLSYSGHNPSYDNNLSRIWGGDGALFGAGVGSSGVDYTGTSAATVEGRDMYEYAWNEWERPLTDSSHSNTASPIKVKSRNPSGSAGETTARANHDEGGVEELRSAFFGNDRKDRGGSSVSAHSSTSWPSKCNNASLKDGCSNSSKTFSDAAKEGKRSGRVAAHVAPKRQHPHHSSSKKASSSSKPPSHYNTVSPPPGFESSPFHMTPGPDSQYGLDDFMGTSAKVQQWLQQSQQPSEEGGDQTASKQKSAKKKSKKVNPIAGDVASFLRNYESMNPSLVDEIGKTTAGAGGDWNPTKDPANNSRSCNSKCSFQDNAAAAPTVTNKDPHKAFFDPKRIFQETAATPPAKKSPEKKISTPKTHGDSSVSGSYFDPKRIFQTKSATNLKDHVKLSGSGKDRLNDMISHLPSLRGNKTGIKSADEKNKRPNSDFSAATLQGCFAERQSTLPYQYVKSSHKPNEENHIGMNSSSFTAGDHLEYSSPPLNSRGSGDNRPIMNKGSACNSSGAYSQVESINCQVGGVDPPSGGTRPGLSQTSPVASSPSKDHAKAKQTSQRSSKEFTQSEAKATDEGYMRTRSQSRREEKADAASKQHHSVPTDGVQASKANSSHNNQPAKKSSYHNAFGLDDDDGKANSSTFAKDRNSNASNHSIPNARDKSESRGRRNTAPSPATKHPPGRMQKETQPGCKRNKSSKNQRSEGKTGKQRRDLPRHYRSESPAGNKDHNGTAKVHGRHGTEKGGRYRPDSEGTKSDDNPAHYYDADQFYQWMKAIVHFAIWICGFVLFLIMVMVAYFYSTCKVWIEYLIHIVTELWRALSETLGINDPNSAVIRWWTRCLLWLPWRRGSGGEDSPDGAGDFRHGQQGKQADFVELPTTSCEAIKRIMACDAEDAYAVLGVADRASDDDIKKYYRKQCVMVHPDKCNLRHANDAFQRLQKGYETLTDPMKRYDLDRQRASACEAEDMINDIYEKMKEAMNTLNCNMCENKHKRYPIDRPCYEARYCRRCQIFHGATEGDMWAETTHMGFKWHYYACMDDAVFDITEWAKCQNLSHMEANACEVRYRIGSNRRRQPGPFVPPRDTPPRGHHHHQHPPGFEDFGNGDGELDDLLRHLFGDRANRTANDPRTSSSNSGYNNANSSGRSSSNRKRRHRHKKY